MVFNIEGDEYRRIVAIAQGLQIVYAKFVGTPGKCGAVDAHTIEPE